MLVVYFYPITEREKLMMMVGPHNQARIGAVPACPYGCVDVEYLTKHYIETIIVMQLDPVFHDEQAKMGVVLLQSEPEFELVLIGAQSIVSSQLQ